MEAILLISFFTALYVVTHVVNHYSQVNAEKWLTSNASTISSELEKQKMKLYAQASVGLLCDSTVYCIKSIEPKTNVASFNSAATTKRILNQIITL